MIPKLQEGCGGSIIHIVEINILGVGAGFLHIPIYFVGVGATSSLQEIKFREISHVSHVLVE